MSLFGVKRTPVGAFWYPTVDDIADSGVWMYVSGRGGGCNVLGVWDTVAPIL